MNNKSSIIQKATQNIKQDKIILYHVIGPIDNQQFMQIKESGYFNASQNALGGQSDGYYFFTTHRGAQNHIETNKDLWGNDDNKHVYIIECETALNNIKYPKWKLDYEATQDFLFDMIYDAANRKVINLKGIEIKALPDKKLSVCVNGKFSKIQSFSANNHSGLIEIVSDFLYKSDMNFKNAYDMLLQKTLSGDGEYDDLYAIKTDEKLKISNITQIENEKTQPQTTNSQIDKFLARYGRGRR